MVRVKYILLFLLAIITSCDSETDNVAIDYLPPQYLEDGIEVASAVDMGYDLTLLGELKAANKNDKDYINIHSILIAKEGKLFFEEYFPGRPIYGPYTEWDHKTLHQVHSVTKSFTSALIGLAIDQGYLEINDHVSTFYPELDSLFEEEKSSLTIEHLLTMSSGLQWDEGTYGYDDRRNDNNRMNHSENPVAYVLQNKIIKIPGEQFLYNSGLSVTLGDIITRSTGMHSKVFAKEFLFEPLNISEYFWSELNGNITHAGGGLHMRPRDILKFGLLFLNDGVWKGNRVLSEEWCNSSTSAKGAAKFYGYQWWRTNYEIVLKNRKYNAYLAGGRGGQYIIIVDDLELVIVFTAGNDNNLASEQTREIVLKYIIPSILE